MSVPTGNPMSSCDCREAKKTSFCLHRKLIEWFHNEMPEPISVGEDRRCDPCTYSYVILKTIVEVSHSRRTVWRLGLAPRAKVLGSLGKKYLER